MKPEEVASLAQELRRQRRALFAAVANTDADLQLIAEDREGELEERAREEWTARLDHRGRQAIEAIDTALQRIADGTYGVCTACGRILPLARLHALPATPLCVDCARAHEAPTPSAGGDMEVSHQGPLPADTSLLTNGELEGALQAQLRDDGRVPMGDLRIACRPGVVYLDGSVPNEATRGVLLQLITDVAGLQEVVDRLHVEKITRPPGGRKRSPKGRRPGFPPSTAEDMVQDKEEGHPGIPPIAPGATTNELPDEVEELPMQLPPQITFRDMEPSPAVEAKIRERAGKLDEYYDRIMSCRVVVEAPHHHRRQGNLFHVTVDLTVPSGELVVNREPSKRHAHEDVYVAIRDAFNAAQRRLADYARRQRRDVKTHEPAPAARVVRLFPEEGYGFLEATDGHEVYFHKNSVVNEDFARMGVGAQVQFVEEQGDKGPQASTVRLVR